MGSSMALWSCGAAGAGGDGRTVGICSSGGYGGISRKSLKAKSQCGGEDGGGKNANDDGNIGGNRRAYREGSAHETKSSKPSKSTLSSLNRQVIK